MLRLKDSLAVRLTVWYTMVFSISTLIAFLSFFLLTKSILLHQRDRELLNEIKEFSIIFSTGGLDKVKEGMDWETASEGVDNIFLRLFSLTGEQIAATDMTSWRAVPAPEPVLEQLKKSDAGYVFQTLSVPHHVYKTRVIYSNIGPGEILQFGQSLKDDEAFLEIFGNVFFPIILVVMVIAALTGWFMARRALTGVEEITQTADHISKGDFERRVTVKAKGYEIEQLATAFNYMLERINILFREMKEMSNNIAHDLRSPIARIRGAAEMTLTTVTSIDENKAIAAGMIEDCDHLLGMINTMLDIAEAESGVTELKLEEVDIAEVVKNACELFMPVAEDNNVCLTNELSDGCIVSGKSSMLQRMVGNLLDNALKYTPPKGTVTASVVAQKGQVIITVSDSGIGISEKDLPHIFKKFYRCDYSRAQRGNGLGLSLVKAIVGSHGGDITVTSTSEKGSVFTVTLPQSPHDC